MPKRLLFIIIISFLLSCNDNKPRIEMIDEKDLTQTQIDSILDAYNFVYSNLTFIDSTSQVLLPITTQKNYTRKSYRSSSYDSYDARDYPTYWNILFFKTDDTKTNLLTNSKIRIEEFKCNIKNSGPILKNSILYKIGDTDYNQDKRFNYEDPIHLFISKIDGSGLTRISPLNENLESYRIVPNSDKIIFRTNRDVDFDRDFDNEDELIWYQIDVSVKNSLKEIIKASDRKQIEALYFQQWLVKSD